MKLKLVESNSPSGKITLEIIQNGVYIDRHTSRNRAYIDRKITNYLATGKFTYTHANPVRGF